MEWDSLRRTKAFLSTHGASLIKGRDAWRLEYHSDTESVLSSLRNDHERADFYGRRFQVPSATGE